MLNAYKNLTWSVVNLVNAPRGRTYQQQRDKLLLKDEQRQQFVAAAQQIVANRLALGSLGELSLRLSSNQLAITVESGHLAHLTETDIITCPIDSDKPQEAAATHLSWHRLVYLETSAQAVLLGHPQYALTLANAAQLPAQQLMPAMEDIIGGVTLLPITELSPAALGAAVQKQHVVLAPQIGALIWGDSLKDMLARAEALEYVSQLTIIARQSNLTRVSS
jgi:ribulose-5-phosphate 4-epimerase/fuculose-1-phosphate aldolase